MARQRKTPKPKQPSYQRINRETDTLEVYDALDECIASFKSELKAEGCRIALAWRYGLKRNKDSQLKLGNLKKVSELDKEYAAFDWIIILNIDTWKEFNDDQRQAVMHHFLCGIAISTDQNGNTKKDARNRTMFRGRKPDIVEYGEVVQHHGCYVQDLEYFALAMIRSKKPPQPALPGLGDKDEEKTTPGPEPSANGHAEPSANGHASTAAAPPREMPAAARRRPVPRSRQAAKEKAKPKGKAKAN